MGNKNCAQLGWMRFLLVQMFWGIFVLVFELHDTQSGMRTYLLKDKNKNI